MNQGILVNNVKIHAMEIEFFDILVGLSSLFIILYYYFTWNFKFWTIRNVRGPKPIPIFGNLKNVILGKTHFALQLKMFYEEFKEEPLVGIYLRNEPVLIVKDPAFIRDVLTKDFNTFPDRLLTNNIKNDPVGENLLNLKHEQWRPLRIRLSPVFTSSKLKNMFYLMVDCANHFESYVEKIIEKKKTVDIHELTAKFATESIGVCAFGLNTDALTDENSEFRKYCRTLFASNFRNKCRHLLRDLFPRIYALLGSYAQNQALPFFIKVIKETLELRKKNNIKRNDFVDLLIELQNHPEKLNTFEFTDNLLMAQALIFFLAGFESSATTMCNALYELAINPNIQDKLREEIKNKLTKDGEKFTYDNIKNMKYLDKVLKESQRKYATGGIIQRKAVTPYTFHGTEVSIPAGTRIIIPIWAIHRDSKLYPDPDVFNPERFSEENEKNRHRMNYLPFGDGPRNCIGDRFAKYQMRIGIAALINKFKVNVCEETIIPYRIDPSRLILSPIGGLSLQITKL